MADVCCSNSLTRVLVLTGIFLAASVGHSQTLSLVSSAPAGVRYGASVTLTAALVPPTAGKVTYYDGATVLGVKAMAAGSASLTTTLLPSGTRKLRALFS